MKRAILTLGLLVPALILSACGGQQRESDSSDNPRIVVLGGSVAETVVGLGAADFIVARDDSSVYPDTLLNWPSVGYFRMIGAEAVLSVNPTLILADAAAGPEAALQQLESTGIRVVRLPGGPSPDDIERQVRAIADELDREERADALIEDMRSDLAAADQVVEESGREPRVLLALGQDGGALTFAGSGTNADEFFRLAGADNVFGKADGYKPMSSEAIVEANPEIVVLLGRTVQSFGGVENIAARPEMRGIQPRFVVLPDEALGFGPSLGEFVLDFACRIHMPEASSRLSACAHVNDEI